MPSTNPEAHPANPERALDRALKDSFPASDPPAATSFTPPATSEAANEDDVCAWVVMPRTCAEKPVEQWRSCGQGRWVSANVQTLFASLSPASALLEALVNHDLVEGADEWVLVSLKMPPGQMLPAPSARSLASASALRPASIENMRGAPWQAARSMRASSETRARSRA